MKKNEQNALPSSFYATSLATLSCINPTCDRDYGSFTHLDKPLRNRKNVNPNNNGKHRKSDKFPCAKKQLKLE